MRTTWCGLGLIGCTLLVGLGGGCTVISGDEDSTMTPVPGGDGIAHLVAGVYQGNAVINYVPSTSFIMTVSASDDDTISVTGNGVSFTADLIQVDELITSLPGADHTIKFDTEDSPLSFDWVENSTSNSFKGTRQE